MQLYILVVLIVAFSTTCVTSVTNPNNPRSDCADGFNLCSPAGATSSTTPKIGSPEFRSLFTDIVFSLPEVKRATSDIKASLCCVAGISCLTMANRAIPFCYDKFRTSYFLADGSYGTLVDGSYTSGGGDIANLTTGDYILINGQKGNLYSGDEAAKPDTATLPMPTLWTASGFGSAIPASALGGRVTLTYTTTFPGSTIAPTTLPPSTIGDSLTSISRILPVTATRTVSSSIILETSVSMLVSPSTRFGTTIPGTTISGSTMAPSVATITTTEASSIPSAASSSNTAGKKNSANERMGISSKQFAICVEALLFVLWVYL